MTNEGFAELFGAPARRPEGRLDGPMDLAASLQCATEGAVLWLARSLASETEARKRTDREAEL